MTLSKETIDRFGTSIILTGKARPIARELDQLVGLWRKLASDAAVTWWKAAKVITRIHDTGAFRVRYATWGEFVRAELRDRHPPCGRLDASSAIF